MSSVNFDLESNFIIEAATKAYALGGMGDALAAAFALADVKPHERERMTYSEMQELLLKSGGPAYPGEIQNNDRSFYAFLGMTIRDHFAGQVIASMVKDGDDFASIAKRAYQIADAMLEARRADWSRVEMPVKLAAG